jgi:uncharacterized membrane protein YesL
VRDALRHFRTALSEYYFDLPRMVLLNLFWFLLALPALFVGFVVITMALGAGPTDVPPLAVVGFYGVIFLALALALAGPATAGVYFVMNRVANGELFEPMRFWGGFRRYFWRGWLLALVDVGVGALLALNIWFYWQAEPAALRLLSILFSYILVFWFAIQGYLFALLVEMNQAIRLVIRNALFMALDNLGLTLGLTLVNLFWFLVCVLPWTAGLPLLLAAITITANARRGHGD